MSNDDEIAEAAANAILNDLCDRKGVGDELDQIKNDDPDIWAEIVEAVKKPILKAMELS